MSDLPEVKNAPSATVALHELWRRCTEWIGDVEAVHAFVKRALSAGEFLAAHDAARAALELHPDDDWLQQRLALALAQMGSSVRAQAILNSLVTKDPTNRETLSILGRTYKDQWCAEPESDHYLRQAFDWAGEGDALELYFGATSGEVFGSADAGATWFDAATHLPPVHSVTVYRT